MEIMLIAGTVMSAIGQIQQGNAQAANYQMQAQAAERNARITEMNSQAAAAQAAQAEDAQRRRARQVLGQQRAAMVQNTGGFGGTNALVIEQSATNAELDALNVRYEGELKRRGLLNEAGNQRYEASINRANSKTAKQAGYWGAATSLLSGGVQYGQYKGG